MTDAPEKITDILIKTRAIELKAYRRSLKFSRRKLAAALEAKEKAVERWEQRKEIVPEWVLTALRQVAAKPKM